MTGCLRLYWRCSPEHEFGRYYSAFFHRFKRVGRMNPQASMTARLKNGTSNNPSTSSLMAINYDMDVVSRPAFDAGPPLIQHIGWIPGSFSDDS